MLKRASIEYFPHWVVNAYSTAAWSARMSQSENKVIICPKCKGRGGYDTIASRVSNLTDDTYRIRRCTQCKGAKFIEGTYSGWRNESGYVSEEIRNLVIPDPKISDKIFCGQRADFHVANSNLISNQNHFYYEHSGHATIVNTVINSQNPQIRSHLKQEVKNLVEEIGANINSINLANIDTQVNTILRWYYPILEAKYLLRGVSIHIQLDGITNEIYLSHHPGQLFKDESSPKPKNSESRQSHAPSWEEDSETDIRMIVAVLLVILLLIFSCAFAFNN